MTFVNSVKLFFSNWEKVLKLFLCYIVVWGISICLLIPVFLEFENVITSNINSTFDLTTYSTVFHQSFGGYLHTIFLTIFNILTDCFNANVGLLVYGFIVLFIIMPFLINVVKYAIYETLYGYMASKSKVGFFSALVKTLNKSLLYSLMKTFLNLIFYALITYLVFLLGLIEDVTFQNYYLALCEFLILVVLFTHNKIVTTGWAPAIIIFGCSVPTGFIRGIKVCHRRFGKTLLVGFLIYVVFFIITFMAGIYSLIITVPIAEALLCMFDMTMFFTSQGMRFYVNNTTILTPKKLEEVDNINKAKYIL